MSLTAHDLQARLQSLASETEDTLKQRTAAELRTILSSLGIKAITRNGINLPLSSGRKAEFLEAILQVLVPTHIAVQVIPDLTEDGLKTLQEGLLKQDFDYESCQADVVERYYIELRKYVTGRWNEQTQTFLPPDGTLAILAASFQTLVSREYPTIEQYHTRLNVKAARFNGIEKVIREQDANQWYLTALLDTFENFKTLVNKGFQDDSILKKQHKQESLNERHKAKSTVNITRALDWAHSILSRDDYGKTTYWKDVCLALMLVTGRRPYSELLSTLSFEYVDESQVLFTGQAKCKGQKESVPYAIPTLVDAKLVIRGYEFLKQYKQILEGTDEERRNRAAKRYSKDFGYYFQQWAELTLDWVERNEDGKKLSPHCLRAFYALTAYKRFGHGIGRNLYLARVLGHGEFDQQTAQSYSDDFDVIS